MDRIFPLVGSAVAMVWGIAHIVPVGAVVRGFGSLSDDNRRIVLMEWIAEGCTLVFIGVLSAAVTLSGGSEGCTKGIVYVLSSAMLFGMAVLTLFTGARTSSMPMKLCPAVKTPAAVLIVLGVV